MNPIPDEAKVALVGITFCPKSQTAWTVQDNRKGKEFPCLTKGEVLNQIAAILDDMHLPPSKLDQSNDPLEITVAVRLQASLCDEDDGVSVMDLRRAAAEAVETAVLHNQGDGFCHPLADKLSLGVLEVRTLNVE